MITPITSSTIPCEAITNQQDVNKDLSLLCDTVSSSTDLALDPFAKVEHALSVGDWSHPIQREHAQLIDTISANIEHLFGSNSAIVEPTHIVHPILATHLSNACFYQGVVILLMILYFLMLYSNGNEAHLLVKGLYFERNSGQRILERRNSFHNGFLRQYCLLGAIGIGVLVVHLCDTWFPNCIYNLTQIEWHLFCLFATLAVLAIFLFEWIILWSIGHVTLTQSTISTILYIKQFYFAQATLITLPSILLYALCPIGCGSGWLYLTAFMGTVSIALFLKEVHSLFMTKNIPNLLWILYLCIVEVAPIAFAVLSLVKYN
jgi:hypothetical protein